MLASISIHRTRIASLLTFTLLAASIGMAKAQSPQDFVMQYPGRLPQHGKVQVERYIAENQALEKRGPIDVQALVQGRLPKTTPGIGPTVVVTEAMVRYNNNKYDPENPLLNITEYARTLGYRNILAYPTFGANDDIFMEPYPNEARDTLLVSQLNHSITTYLPIYPGDTLYLVANKRTVTDVTPQKGSLYRHLIIRTDGSIYNQRAEKVNDVTFRVMESLKLYQDSKRPAGIPNFAQIWEPPNWKSRPAHIYTDEDWKQIRKIWQAEKRRGSQPLYWEDVKIGDQPIWTAEGPIEESPIPTKPFGMGTGGSRTLKKEILDLPSATALVRTSKGIWRLRDRAKHIPLAPREADMASAPQDTINIDSQEIHKKEEDAVNTADIHKKDKSEDNRSVLVNFLGRDLAIRHINNWMGDQGWLYNIRWGIMPASSLLAVGKSVPDSPDVVHFLAPVPFMKGRDVDSHPLSGDLFIVKSYVYDKYFRDGQSFVELAWWIETIDQHIIEAGGATIRLPSRLAGTSALPLPTNP